MRIMLLNGSPKIKGGASSALVDGLCQRLQGANECVVHSAIKTSPGALVEAAKGCRAIVVVAPLYVDGLPSHLLRLLDGIKGELKNSSPGAVVYAVMNNGFYEARQNSLALEMIRNFCEAASLSWGQGLGVGAGGMIFSAPIGSGPMKNLGAALDKFSKNICAADHADNLFVEPNFPRFLYKVSAHVGWRQQAKKNGLKARDLYAKR